MKVRIRSRYVNGDVDTINMKLADLPGRKAKGSLPSLCIKENFYIEIAEIDTGDLEGSNALCKEITRRFNEFPEELKR